MITRRALLLAIPTSIKYFLTWAVEADRVVPTFYDWQAVRLRLLTTAKLDDDGTGRVGLCRQIVERIVAKCILLEIALVVVNADRPEAIDRDILEG